MKSYILLELFWIDFDRLYLFTSRHSQKKLNSKICRRYREDAGASAHSNPRAER